MIKASLKSSNEEPYKHLVESSNGKIKEKVSNEESKKDGKIKNGADKDNVKNTNDSLNKAKELLTKEQKERQRQMSIISF